MFPVNDFYFILHHVFIPCFNLIFLDIIPSNLTLYVAKGELVKFLKNRSKNKKQTKEK
jgi:hypothetical protein